MSQDKEENHLIEERRKKLAELRKADLAFPNDFKRKDLAQELKDDLDQFSKAELEKKKKKASVAGRVMLRRMMGKASFTTIQDFSGRIQLYVRADEISNYDEFKNYDLGDIVGVEGTVFKTNTGELSIHAKKIKLLTKSLRPLPEKHLGLTDTEARYRKRYLDLLTNPESLEVFKTRAELINNIRSYLVAEDFIEVETPMMHSIPGGATARPFVTHHNSLNMDLFLRVAPELYLKRLVVGGFEKVFEINRNFRNEGLSTRHNPEFTMLEFYTAYVNSDFQITFVEKMFKAVAKSLSKKSNIFKKPFHKYNPISKFPIVKRDLSFIFDKNQTYSEIKYSIESLNIKNLSGMELFDVYEGDKIPVNKKSYGINFAVSNFEKTLTEKEINFTMDKIQKRIQSQFNATLRDK